MSDFRRSAKKIFLTYPICPVSKEKLLELLKNKGPYNSVYIGQEVHTEEDEHEDGAWGALHLHAAIDYKSKIRSRSARFFDLVDSDGQVYHPHEEAARDYEDISNYCIKEDKEPIIERKLDMSHSREYRKRKLDHYALEEDLEQERKKPIPFIDSVEIMGCTHSFYGKQSGMILVGGPNTRKTTFTVGSLVNTPSGPEHYPGFIPDGGAHVVTNELYPFEGYKNQQFIVYDDVIPDVDTLKLLSNTPLSKGQSMPGKQRYVQVPRPAGLFINVIIILNEDKFAQFNSNANGIAERFILYRVKTPLPSRPKAAPPEASLDKILDKMVENFSAGTNNITPAGTQK